MEINCLHPFTFLKLSHQSVEVISLQLEGPGVRAAPVWEPAWNGQLGLAERGCSRSGPACSSVLLLVFVWAGSDLD